MCVETVDGRLRSLQRLMETRRTYLDQLEAARQQLGNNVQHALALIQNDINSLVAKVTFNPLKFEFS